MSNDTLAWHAVQLCVTIEIHGHRLLRRASVARGSAPVDQMVERQRAIITRVRAGTIPDGPVAREGPERPVQAAPAADGSAPADMARLRSAQKEAFWNEAGLGLKMA